MCFLHKFTISIKVASKFESWHLRLVNDSPSANGGGKKHALDGVNFEEEEEEEVERWPCYAPIDNLFDTSGATEMFPLIRPSFDPRGEKPREAGTRMKGTGGVLIKLVSKFGQ